MSFIDLLRKTPYLFRIQEHTDQKKTPYLDTFHTVVMKDIFLSKWMLNILKNDLPFLPERMKIEKTESLQLIYMIKPNMLFTKEI